MAGYDQGLQVGVVLHIHVLGMDGIQVIGLQGVRVLLVTREEVNMIMFWGWLVLRTTGWGGAACPCSWYG